ncbi:MAG: hypothetical protein ACFCVE_11155 [Phycisphaerae bacterium]
MQASRRKSSPPPTRRPPAASPNGSGVFREPRLLLWRRDAGDHARHKQVPQRRIPVGIRVGLTLADGGQRTFQLLRRQLA